MTLVINYSIWLPPKQRKCNHPMSLLSWELPLLLMGKTWSPNFSHRCQGLRGYGPESSLIKKRNIKFSNSPRQPGHSLEVKNKSFQSWCLNSWGAAVRQMQWRWWTDSDRKWWKWGTWRQHQLESSAGEAAGTCSHVLHWNQQAINATLGPNN